MRDTISDLPKTSRDTAVPEPGPMRPTPAPVTSGAVPEPVAEFATQRTVAPNPSFPCPSSPVMQPIVLNGTSDERRDRKVRPWPACLARCALRCKRPQLTTILRIIFHEFYRC